MSQISITLRTEDIASSKTFLVSSTASLADIMDNFSQMNSLTCAQMFFQFDGRLVFPYQTPADLGMEDGDIIDVRVNMGGGGGKRGRSASPEEEEGRRRRL